MSRAARKTAILEAHVNESLGLNGLVNDIG